jgi:iron complex outermembrane receptor protein
MGRIGFGIGFRCMLIAVACCSLATAFSQTPASASNSRKKPPSRTTASADSTSQQLLFQQLKRLNETWGVYFLFSDPDFGDRKVETADVQGDNVDQILSRLLNKTGLGFRKLNDKTYVIIASQESVSRQNGSKTNALYELPFQQHIDGTNPTGLIKGKVVNTQGIAIPDVSIVVKGKQQGTLTTTDGNFVLSIDKGDIIELSFIGFQKKEIVFDPAAGRSLTIVMTPTESKLDEVVITALGVRKENRALGYSVNTVHARDLTAAGNTNFASALYGRAPGLRVTTAPGGATSAVQVQVRGLSSLNFNAQPMFIVDGVVIRNINEKGVDGINNNGYWNDQRIRGNGILDINPMDIEQLTVLKGASATALYGSEAAAGVVVITTKKGVKKPGFGIEINYSGSVEKAAFLPKFQNVYGPGFDRSMNLAEGATAEGWIPLDTDGDGIFESYRPNFNAYAQFGPEMKGQMVPWWDGTQRRYSPQPDNYKNLYRTGFNSAVNAAISNHTEKVNYRVSFTRNDYKGIQQGGQLQRNTVHLNSNYKINEKISADIVTSYFNSKVQNRPLQQNRIYSSYLGFFSRAEDMDVVFNKYKTSADYKWVPWNQSQRNPAEALRYNTKTELLDFLWTQLRNREVEEQDRILSSITLNYAIAPALKLRARFGNDFTSLRTDTKRYNEYPIAFNGTNSTGAYGISDGRYAIVYGDALLSFTRKAWKDFTYSINGGYQVRKEKYQDQQSFTSGGLLKENWFSLENSFGPITATANHSELLKYAFLGFFNLSYKQYFYLEATARQEYSSTLPPGNNKYFYPSVNAAFIVSEAFNLLSFLKYAKIRSSFGMVGNAPPAYASAITYAQTTIPTVNGPVGSLSAQQYAGNNNIRPENKYEFEVGFETRMFNNRFGFDLTYYNNRTVNQVIQVSLPVSTGALSKLVNAGELGSRGLELSLYAIPIATRNFKWNVGFNTAFDNTTVKRLTSEVKQLVFYQAEQNAIRIVADEGGKVGNIYVNPRLTDDAGNYIIGANGLYVIDNTRYKKVGNVMPVATGGITHSLSYKNFSLDLLVDYRIGGKMISAPMKYKIGTGQYESTLKYRNEANGGLPYYIDGAGIKHLLPSHGSVSPDGSAVYHDGIILDGVNGNKIKNTTIVDAAYYYSNMFAWGSSSLNEEGAVFKNSYVKMRELVLGYTFSQRIANKLRVQQLRFSLVGRNLFYFYRTLKNLDPETVIGSNWVRQNVDEGSMAATRSLGFSLNLGF